MFTAKRRAKIVFVVSILVIFNLIWFIVDQSAIKPTHSNANIYIKNLSAEHLQKKDWNDYHSMAASLNRSGPGEQGTPVLFEEYNKALYERYGFQAVLSDIISLNRSVPDVRYEECKKMSYLANLPKSAIIIIFYNERLSTLLRTVYSILNRTPVELIEEIILVDDGSTWPDLQEPLDNFLKHNFPPEHSKVRLLRLPKRRGLMVARMEGARKASKTSEVLIFLDSHFEMMHNWLPPLLEPIALNPKTCTIPSLDRIAFDTFYYMACGELRGYFNWALGFEIHPLHADELAHPARNFRAYVMMGGALAINAEYFWHLGGFDDGMIFWGGEQFELSFKIWMCGGEVINVPCSRMGHLYRDPYTNGNTNLYKDYSFMDKNIRRLIDVWFDDEHRQYVLNHRKNAGRVYPGDLSSRFALRDKLKCKSFSWMLDNIMPDMKKEFPPVEPLNYGNGVIRNFVNPEICILLDANKKEVNLKKCDSNNSSKIWTYSWRCELRSHDLICMESDIKNGRVIAYPCHKFGANQKWFYDANKRWIVHTGYNLCMVPNADNTKVDLKICDIKNLNMQWSIGSYNETLTNECQSIKT